MCVAVVVVVVGVFFFHYGQNETDSRLQTKQMRSLTNRSTWSKQQRWIAINDWRKIIYWINREANMKLWNNFLCMRLHWTKHTQVCTQKKTYTHALDHREAPKHNSLCEIEAAAKAETKNDANWCLFASSITIWL